MLLGLTGDIACGKSTVARMLAGYGAMLIDADALVHELYTDPAFAARVASLFERPVLAVDGTVDRARLGAVVFQNSGALQRLEALVHPAVADLRDRRIERLRRSDPAAVIVIEAVKLIESGQAAGCDAVWCVTCSREVQLARLMQERGLTYDQACERLASQPSFAAKRALLGPIPLVLLENNGTLAELERQVSRQWDKLKEIVRTEHV